MTDRRVGSHALEPFDGQPLTFAALTDVGRVREQNEDACGVRTRSEATLPIDAVLIAADGVGGHLGGAVASRFVVDAVCDTIADQPSIDDLPRFMEQLLVSAHRELLREAAGRGMQSAMGSTATVAVIDGTRLVIAHVGDSRAYRLRDGVLEQLTQDDSWVAEQARAGLLTEEEIASNPQKNVLTQCMGIGESLNVHVTREELRAGDRYLLCSDGLHGEVDDAGIAEVLREYVEPEEAGQLLVDQANRSGGPDNITAVVFDIGSVAGATRRAETAGPSISDTLDFAEAVVAERTMGSKATPQVPPLVGRPGASWVITAGLALLIGGAAAGSWSTLRSQPAADLPAATATQTEAADENAARAEQQPAAMAAPATDPGPPPGRRVPRVEPTDSAQVADSIEVSATAADSTSNPTTSTSTSADSTPADSIPSDSVPSDSVPSDSAPADSAASPDSVGATATPEAESTLPDSAAAEPTGSTAQQMGPRSSGSPLQNDSESPTGPETSPGQFHQE